MELILGLILLHLIYIAVQIRGYHIRVGLKREDVADEMNYWRTRLSNAESAADC